MFLWFHTTHSFHMPISYPTRHNHFMNHAKHTSCSIIYTYITHHTIILNQDKSFRDKQTASHCAVSPNTSLRLRGLAQARQSRSGESPSAQARAQNQETGTTAGSRLGEIPLAWASGSLAQKLSKSPGRLIAKSGVASLRQTRLGEPDSPGRD